MEDREGQEVAAATEESLGQGGAHTFIGGPSLAVVNVGAVPVFSHLPAATLHGSFVPCLVFSTGKWCL